MTKRKKARHNLSRPYHPILVVVFGHTIEKRERESRRKRKKRAREGKKRRKEEKRGGREKKEQEVFLDLQTGIFAILEVSKVSACCFSSFVMLKHF